MRTARSRTSARSPRVQTALWQVRSAVADGGPVLLCGEPGTGRETVARAIHRAAHGDRTPIEDLLQCGTAPFDSPAPFVVADCAVKRDIESLLFGAMPSPDGRDSLERISRGALLHQARGGTLFLRGVQEMPGRIQNRLALVLRDDEVWLDDNGGSKVVAMDFRVIAAIDSVPDRDGSLLVPELKKRLAVHFIELPPLRHRREDVPGLVRLQVAEFCARLDVPGKTVSSQAIALLCALPWHGNLPELRELVHVLVTNVAGRTIRVPDVLALVRLDGGDVTFPTGGTLKAARERFERDYVAAVLKQHKGRIAQAARVLGMQRPNLYRKVRQLAVSTRPSLPQYVAADTRPGPRDADRAPDVAKSETVPLATGHSDGAEPDTVEIR